MILQSQSYFTLSQSSLVLCFEVESVLLNYYHFYSSNLSDRCLFKSRKPILCNQMVWDAFMLEFTQAKCSKIFGYYLILNKILRNKNVSFIIDILLVIRVCLRPCNLCFIIMVLFVFRHLCCVKQFFFQIT